MVILRVARGLLGCSLAALLLAGGAVAGATGGAWPAFHGNNQHTGLATVAGPQSLSLAWYALAFDNVVSGPVIGDDGTVYFTSTDGVVHAYGPGGNRKWIYGSGARIFGSPALSPNGRVIVADLNGRVRALNAADGTVAWTALLRASTRATPLVTADGSIYIGTERGDLVALDSNGQEKGRVAAEAGIAGAPALGHTGDIYWGALDRRLRRMNDRLHVVWSRELEGAIEGAPAIAADGTVYVGAGGSLVAVDSTSGAVKWRRGLGATIAATPSIGPDGTVYAGAENGVFVAFWPSGEVRWQMQTGGAIRGSAAVGSDGTVYFGSGDAIIYAIDREGQRIATYRALDAVHGSLAIGPDGTLYAGSNDNRLYALRDSTRRFVESPPDRLGGDLVRDPGTGRVFVIVDGVRRYIPDPLTQLLLGLAGRPQQVLTGAEIARYPEGPALPALRDGSLIQASNGPIYVIGGGRRVWIPSLEAFVAGGYAWESVIPVEDRVVRSVPLALADGMLLRGTGEQVYLLDGGRRRWITSAAVLAARGQTWADVHFVDEDTLQRLPEGEPIGAI